MVEFVVVAQRQAGSLVVVQPSLFHAFIPPSWSSTVMPARSSRLAAIADRYPPPQKVTTAP